MKRRPKALEERRRLSSRCSLIVVFLTASAIVSLLSANPVMHASYDADHEVLPAPAVELSGAVLPAVSSTAAEIVQLLNSHPVAALLMEVNGEGENLLSPASADFSGGEDGQLTSTASQVAEFLAASPETSALFTVTGGGGNVLNPAGPLALAGGSSSVERDGTSYAWDAQGRLAAVTMKDGLKYGYRYDYRTRRVGIERAAHGDAPARHTAVAFSGGLSLVEHESEARPASLQGLAGAVRYVRGPDMGGGVGGLLYSRRGETLKYNLSNGRGDIVAQSDAAGALTWTASYEAYGKRTKETGENADKQRANTKDEDPTGLLNEGFRYRDLETGAWLSRDPAGFVDGPNLYAYVKQNPWTHWDPEGLRIPENQKEAKASAAGIEKMQRRMNSLVEKRDGLVAREEKRGRTAGGAKRIRNLTTDIEATAKALHEDVEDLKTYMRGLDDPTLPIQHWNMNEAQYGHRVYAEPGIRDTTLDLLDIYGGAGLVRGVMSAATNALGKFAARSAAKTVGNGADDVLNGLRLRNQLAGQEIAGGHAFGKHASEFGFKTQAEMAAHVERVMANPTAMRNLSKGRSAYWDDATQSVVIRNPSAVDGGTTFRPTAGRSYFDNLK